MGAATGKNPKKRNKLAGKSTGTSESTKYFNANPDKKKEKNRKNAIRQKSESSKNRVESTKAQRKSPAPKGYDKSHTKSGKIVNEKASKNRARNGKNGKSTKK
jgi:hypothetical protein